jgi:hypothetical protein
MPSGGLDRIRVFVLLGVLARMNALILFPKMGKHSATLLANVNLSCATRSACISVRF